MHRGEYEGENDGGQRGPYGVDQALKWIAAKRDFLCQRSRREDQKIDDQNPELTRNCPEGDDQSAAEDQRQNARQQHAPAQRGAQAELSLPAGTENQAHGADGFALAVEGARHRGVAENQQKQQNAALEKRKPQSGSKAIGGMNRNTLGDIEVDRGDDDVAERPHAIGSCEMGQAYAPVGIDVSGVLVEPGNLPELRQSACDPILDRHGLQFAEMQGKLLVEQRGGGHRIVLGSPGGFRDHVVHTA